MLELSPFHPSRSSPLPFLPCSMLRKTYLSDYTSILPCPLASNWARSTEASAIDGRRGGRRVSSRFSLLAPSWWESVQTDCSPSWPKIWVLSKLLGSPFLSRSVRGSHTLVTGLRILPHPWRWRDHSFTQNYSQMTEPPISCWNPDTPACIKHYVRCSVQRWRIKMMENKTSAATYRELSIC